MKTYMFRAPGTASDEVLDYLERGTEKQSFPKLLQSMVEELLEKDKENDGTSSSEKQPAITANSQEKRIANAEVLAAIAETAGKLDELIVLAHEIMSNQEKQPETNNVVVKNATMDIQPVSDALPPSIIAPEDSAVESKTDDDSHDTDICDAQIGNILELLASEMPEEDTITEEKQCSFESEKDDIDILAALLAS